MLFGKRERAIHRIVIVEDEPLVAFDNEHFLQGEGFDIVATVDSVADALRCIAEVEEAIHLLLVDVGLADGASNTASPWPKCRGPPGGGRNVQ